MYYLYHINSLEYIELRDGLVFGRNSGTKTFPDDSRMSGEHVRFNVVKDEVYVEDLNSKNNTILDRFTLVPHKKTLMKLESVLEAGLQKFVLLDQQLDIEDLNVLLTKFPSATSKKKDGSELLMKLREEAEKEIGQLIENESKLTALLIEKRFLISDAQKQMIQLVKETEASLKRIEEQKAEILLNVSSKEESLKADIRSLTIDIQTLSQQVTKLKEDIDNRKRKGKK